MQAKTNIAKGIKLESNYLNKRYFSLWQEKDRIINIEKVDTFDRLYISKEEDIVINLFELTTINHDNKSLHLIINWEKYYVFKVYSILEAKKVFNINFIKS